MFHTCLQYEVPDSIAELVWQSLVDGQVFITREGGKSFTFATGQQATLKADAESLSNHPGIIKKLLELYAAHPCVREADVLSFVPNGTADFTEQLGKLTGKPIVHLFRPEGAPRPDMRFKTPEDQEVVKAAKSICAIEDISRTGFSAHITAKILRAINPDLEVHTLSMLQRDDVEQQYQEGPDAVVYHTFVRRDIPLEIDTFKQQFPGIVVQVVP
jgi:hypothetical protein